MIMKKLNIFLLLTFTLVFLLSSRAFAKITVISVRGRVAYKAGRSWAPLRQGMNLREGSKISTGVRSYAVIRLNSNTISIKPLTMIKIYQNRMTKNTSRTRIGLKRGSLRAKIQKGRRVRTVFKVSTPVATSSVRGTEEDISYGPGRGFRALVLSGTVEGSSRNGTRRNISGRQRYRHRSGRHMPDNILDHVRERCFWAIHDKHVSPDEDGSMNDNPDYTGDSGTGAAGIVDSDLRDATSEVNMNITWP